MHLGAIIHENTYYVARFVSLRDPQKISVLVSYWFRTVRTGHGPAGDNHPSAVLESFILFFSVLVSYYPYWLRPLSYWQRLHAKTLILKSFSYWLLVLALV